MKDFLGRNIEVGQTLVYPVRRRSRMWLAKITVTDVSKDTVYGTNESGRRITLSKPGRSMIATLLCEYCGHNPLNSEK